jgi:purine nucleoside permease
MAWRLNPVLVDWAARLTRAVDLPDTKELAALRLGYAGEGARPPSVRTGAVLATNSLWHGALLNRWAEEWVKYWTEGQARFAVSAMEDAGVASSFQALARAGRVDRERLLMLRAASNYTVPPEGVSAAASLAGEMREGFSAYVPALEAAYHVAAPVVNDFIENWKPT